MLDKRQIRQEIKRRKQAITPDERERLSRQICRAIESLPGFERVAHLMLYHALPDEVDTRHLLSKWAGRKQIYPPIVHGDHLIIAHYPGGAMKQGAFHIRTHAATTVIDPARAKLLVAPLGSFSRPTNQTGPRTAVAPRLL